MWFKIYYPSFGTRIFSKYSVPSFKTNLSKSVCDQTVTVIKSKLNIYAFSSYTYIVKDQNKSHHLDLNFFFKRIYPTVAPKLIIPEPMTIFLEVLIPSFFI